jgi:hypothetical protein
MSGTGRPEVTGRVPEAIESDARQVIRGTIEAADI